MARRDTSRCRCNGAVPLQYTIGWPRYGRLLVIEQFVHFAVVERAVQFGAAAGARSSSTGRGPKVTSRRSSRSGDIRQGWQRFP